LAEITFHDQTLEPNAQTQKQDDLNHYCMSWIWRAVECLVGTPEFHSSPKWISQRLGITVEQAVDAIEGLERLGFIQPDGRSFKRAQEVQFVRPNDISRSEILRNHSMIAPQILSKLSQNDKYMTWFFAADEQLLSEFAPKFSALYTEMINEGTKRGCKGVIASDISFANLTSEPLVNGSLR